MPSRRSVTGTRRRATTANQDVRSASAGNLASGESANPAIIARARPSNATTTIYKASTTDQSTMKHDLHGAMSRTLTEQQIEDLAQALHSSWPKKASEIKKKSAAQQMDLERGGIMSHKEGEEGMNLKLALENARKDPRVQSEMHRRKVQAFSPRHHGYTPRRWASTLATPGQDIQSTTSLLNEHSRQNFTLKLMSSDPQGIEMKSSSTAESRRRSLTQLQQSLQQQQQQHLDATGDFVVPQSSPRIDAEMLKKRSKMSYEDSDINPRVKHTRARGKFSATFLSLMRPPCERSNIHILTLEPFCFRKLCVLFNIRTSTASISDFVLETQGHTLRLSACTCQRPLASWG